MSKPSELLTAVMALPGKVQELRDDARKTADDWRRCPAGWSDQESREWARVYDGWTGAYESVLNLLSAAALPELEKLLVEARAEELEECAKRFCYCEEMKVSMREGQCWIHGRLADLRRAAGKAL
jgi:hypothetical protein